MADRMGESFTVIGQSVPRLEVREKVSGRAQYIADMNRPAMLHVALLGSPHAHARIRGYDVSVALKLPGVAAVVTGEDFGDHKMGPFIKDEGAIAKGKVRYVGEPVAAVAAEDEATARLAAQLIEVDYEELPSVLSPEAALTPDCAGHSRRSCELLQGVCSRLRRQPHVAHRDQRRRCRGRLPRQRPRAGGHVRDPGAEPSGARAGRRAGGGRRGRSRHAVVGQPIRVPGSGQRLRSRWGCRCRGCAA